MPYLPFILLLIFGFACKSQNKIQIESATAQNYAGGAAGMGSGINYTIKLSTKIKSDVVIDSIWLGNNEKGMILPLEVYELHKLGTGINSLKNKTLTAKTKLVNVKFKKHSPGQVEKEQGIKGNSIIKKHFDHKFNGEALLFMHSSKAKFYIEVPEFKKLAPLFYP